MIFAGRRVVHGARTGGKTTHEERREWASATPETRAFATVRILEEEHGGARAPAAVIRRMAEDAKMYAEALAKMAEQREREERGEALPFALEDVEVAGDPGEPAAQSEQRVNGGAA